MFDLGMMTRSLAVALGLAGLGFPRSAHAQNGCTLDYQHASGSGSATQTLNMDPGEQVIVNRVDLQRVTNRNDRGVRIRITIPTGGTKWVTLQEKQTDPPIGNYLGNVTLIRAECVRRYTSPVEMYTAEVGGSDPVATAERVRVEFGLEPDALMRELQAHLPIERVGQILRNSYEMTPPSIAALLAEVHYEATDAGRALYALLAEDVRGDVKAADYAAALRGAYGDSDAIEAGVELNDRMGYPEMTAPLWARGFTVADILSAYRKIPKAPATGPLAARASWSPGADLYNSYSSAEVARALADVYGAAPVDVTRWLIAAQEGIAEGSPVPRDRGERGDRADRGQSTRDRGDQGTPSRGRGSDAGDRAASRDQATTPGSTPPAPRYLKDVADALVVFTDDAVHAFLLMTRAGATYEEAERAVIYSEFDLSPPRFAEGMRRAGAPLSEALRLLAGRDFRRDGWDQFAAPEQWPEPEIILPARIAGVLRDAHYPTDSIALALVANFPLDEYGQLERTLHRGQFTPIETVRASQTLHADLSPDLIVDRLYGTQGSRLPIVYALRGVVGFYHVDYSIAAPWFWRWGMPALVDALANGERLRPTAILAALVERPVPGVSNGFRQHLSSEPDSLATWAWAATYLPERAAWLLRYLCGPAGNSACASMQEAEKTTRALARVGYAKDDLLAVIPRVYGDQVTGHVEDWLEPVRGRKGGEPRH